MPLKMGHDKETIQSNIDEMIRAGHRPEQAVAASYAHARKSKKMAEGGMVMGEPEGVQDPHRTLGELQGDSEPEKEEPMDMMDEHLMLAHALKKSMMDDDEEDE